MVSRRSVLGAAATSVLAAGSLKAASAPDLATSASSPGTVLPRGEHRIAANLTIKGDLQLLPGATIHIDAGRKLTLLGDLIAPASHIFRGAGQVDLTRSRLLHARAEWWGAVPDVPEVDSVDAIEACLAAHNSLMLSAGRYYLSRTLHIAASNRRIRGVGRSRPEADRATRLVLTAPEGDVVLVGHRERPGRIIDFVQGLDIAGLHLVRSHEDIDGSATAEAGANAGLRVRYALNCQFSDLVAENHPIGFSLGGTVRSFMRDCQAFMRNSIRGAASGQFWGFHFDGAIDIGLAGGNASLYVGDCNANTTYGEPSPQSIGALLSGAFADIYLVGFEASEVAIGIAARGVRQHASRAVQRAGNADLHVIMPILDQCRAVALELVDTSDHALIDITSPYAALSGPGRAAISLVNCGGQISIVGGQMIGWTNLLAGGQGVGLAADSADGLTITALKLLGFRRPVVLRECSDFDLAVSVNNPDGSGAEAAILLDHCGHGVVRPRIKGSEQSFKSGVRLRDATSVSVEAAGIDGRVVGGQMTRLIVDESPIALGDRASIIVGT